MKCGPFSWAALLTLALTLSSPALDVTVAEYNVENYAPLPASAKAKPGKSARATEAVHAMISEIQPDLIGLCEMGPPAQFEAFRQRLAATGMQGLDHVEYVEAADPDRHLALVTRFPIVERHSVADLAFDANGVREKVKRGFLDVTVQLNERVRLRVVGAHLKSKRPTPEADDALLRRQEAHLLRQHCEAILAETPDVPLLVFGDFNDTKDSPAVQEILGRRGAPEALTDLALADPLGDRWTHYWKVDDVYARIDYLLVNRPLASRLVRERSRVHRSPLWNEASDHRPVVAVFHFPDF